MNLIWTYYRIPQVSNIEMILKLAVFHHTCALYNNKFPLLLWFFLVYACTCILIAYILYIYACNVWNWKLLSLCAFSNCFQSDLELWQTHSSSIPGHVKQMIHCFFFCLTTFATKKTEHISVKRQVWESTHDPMMSTVVEIVPLYQPYPTFAFVTETPDVSDGPWRRPMSVFLIATVLWISLWSPAQISVFGLFVGVVNPCKLIVGPGEGLVSFAGSFERSSSRASQNVPWKQNTEIWGSYWNILVSYHCHILSYLIPHILVRYLDKYHQLQLRSGDWSKLPWPL